jgi:sarcosine oxidase subunit beta
MASTSADVAIIGGGLMGCFSAYFLRRRGRSVIVIEKGSACGAASVIRVRRSVTTMGHILLTLPILLFLLYQRALRAVVDVAVFWSF